METNEQTTAATAQPTARQKPENNGKGGTSPWWILLSVVIGFLLPICGCVVLFGGLVAIGSASGGAGDVPAFSGFDNTTVCFEPAVAVVRVEGTIIDTDDESFLNGAGSARVIADLRAANEDDNVKAILLRVDSPGGTVTGSAQIHEVIQEMDKPVIVSMAGVAASGGYYISTPADHIIARPETVTGSLGVIVVLVNAEDLIADVGVDVINITSGPNKALGSPWDELTAEERAIFEQFVDESYAQFIEVIAEGRSILPSRVRELADGRIYTGRQAIDLDLVDELGNFDDGVSKAAEMGGISDDPCLLEYEHTPTLEDFLAGFSAHLNESEADRIMSLVHDLTLPTLEYRYIGAD